MWSVCAINRHFTEEINPVKGESRLQDLTAWGDFFYVFRHAVLLLAILLDQEQQRELNFGNMILIHICILLGHS